jgi:hypothetical protein
MPQTLHTPCSRSVSLHAHTAAPCSTATLFDSPPPLLTCFEPHSATTPMCCSETQACKLPHLLSVLSWYTSAKSTSRRASEPTALMSSIHVDGLKPAPGASTPEAAARRQQQQRRWIRGLQQGAHQSVSKMENDEQLQQPPPDSMQQRTSHGTCLDCALATSSVLSSSCPPGVCVK